jgi:hypothetical protein
LGEDVAHGSAFAAVAFVDLGFDEVIGCYDDDDFAAECEAEIFDGLGVEGVDEGEVQALVVEVDGECAVEASGAGGDEVEEGVRGSPVAEFDEGCAEFGGDYGPYIVLGLDDFEIGE